MINRASNSPIKKDSVEDFRLIDASIMELQEVLENGQLTSVQLVEHYLARINAYDQQGPILNAIIRINPQALKQATELDKERKTAGARSLLHGIPIILKDNFNTRNIPTSAGSVLLAGVIPSSDAFQVEKLKQAGAIILAKSNMGELAMDITGNSALGGQTRNPYDITCIPGGSSAGTGVAIAANFASVGMGTDTCGSIRIPASFNNLVGLRPSKGLSSTAGIIPLSHHTDVGGPLAKSVRDLAIVMDIVIGYDPQDPTTLLVEHRPSPGFVNSLGSVDLSNLRLGKLEGYFANDECDVVNKTINNTLEKLTKKGVTIVDINTSILDCVVKEITNNKNACYEAADKLTSVFKSYPEISPQSLGDVANLGSYHEILDSFHPLKEIAKNQLDYSRYQTTLQWTPILSNIIVQLLQQYDLDAFIYPTMKEVPVKIGEIQNLFSCMLSSLSGTPALALPAGFTPSGLPVGMELLGPPLFDEKLVAIAYAIEQTLNARRPPQTTPALIDNDAPEPIQFTASIKDLVDITFVFDITRNTLQYKTYLLDLQNTYAVCLHQSKRGAIIQCLSGPEGRHIEGTINLNYRHIKALQKGALYLRLYNNKNPLGELGARVTLPQL